MAFTIPQPIKMLPGGAAFPNLPSRSFLDPNEGRRYIPVEIDWDGAGTTFQVNAQGLTTQPFSQIVMLDVDNSASGSAVTFYFPDSSDTLVVPAGSGGLFPVFTSALNFYVAAPSALASDVTRFRILNYRQEPIANPPPQFTNTAAVTGFSAVGTTALLAAGISGTLSGYSMFGNAINPTAIAVNPNWAGNLVDHTSGVVLDRFFVSLNTGATAAFNGVLWNVTNCQIRFSGGLDLVVPTQNLGAGNVQGVVSLRYRTP